VKKIIGVLKENNVHSKGYAISTTDTPELVRVYKGVLDRDSETLFPHFMYSRQDKVAMKGATEMKEATVTGGSVFGMNSSAFRKGLADKNVGWLKDLNIQEVLRR
jgi:hypothetical protein